MPPTRTDDSSRTPAVALRHRLVASAVGVYLLVIVGAGTALLDGAAACPTWPACDGAWPVTLDDPALAAAWLHRLASLLVGGLLVVTAVAAYRRPADPRTRAGVAVAVVLYPVQVGLGAITAVEGATIALSSAHLAVALVLFGAVVLALLFQLEFETPHESADASATDADARAPNEDGTVAEIPASAEVPDVTGGDPTPDARTGDPEPPEAATGDLGPLDRTRAYVSLTKPKLMWLLCLVALAAMGLAGGRTLDPVTVLGTLGGGVLAIGASGVFNNVLERDVDREMARTADRPLVDGTISVWGATAFGFLLAVASVATFLAFVNPLAAALGVAAIVFYSVVYTMVLKPNTSQNIVIGGAVGAMPALIGWAAVTRTVEMPAVVLGFVIFLWTPAHFYNLALAYRDDYARAGFPMLPVVRGAATTRRHVLLYLGATMVAAVALGAITPLGWVYAATAALVGAVFLHAVVGLYRERTEAAAFRAFTAANAYLGGLLVAILLDTLVV